MTRIIAFLLFVTTVGVCEGQDQWKNIYRESAWKERDSWQRSEELIKWMSLQKGDVAADIGCHEGYMTFKLANVVGAQGKVYAVDIEEMRLNLLNNYLLRAEVDHVTVVRGDYDNPKLPKNSVDAVIILDTYHEMDDHDKILQHVLLALKTGGRLVLCEPLDPKRKDLTRAEQEAKHELGINFALADLKKAGFEIAHQEDPFADRTAVKGDKMWLIVAVKK